MPGRGPSLGAWLLKPMENKTGGWESWWRHMTWWQRGAGMKVTQGQTGDSGAVDWWREVATSGGGTGPWEELMSRRRRSRHTVPLQLLSSSSVAVSTSQDLEDSADITAFCVAARGPSTCHEQHNTFQDFPFKNNILFELKANGHFQIFSIHLVYWISNINNYSIWPSFPNVYILILTLSKPMAQSLSILRV